MDKTNVKSTMYILACDKDLSRPAPGAVAVVAQIVSFPNLIISAVGHIYMFPRLND